MTQPNIKGNVAERVLAVLTKGFGPRLTREAIERILGHETVQVMHALETLRIDGQVVKTGRSWSPVPAAPVDRLQAALAAVAATLPPTAWQQGDADRRSAHRFAAVPVRHTAHAPLFDTDKYDDGPLPREADGGRYAL